MEIAKPRLIWIAYAWDPVARTWNGGVVGSLWWDKGYKYKAYARNLRLVAEEGLKAP